MKRLLIFLGIFCIVSVIFFFVKNLKPIDESNVLPANTVASTPIPTPVAIKQSIVLDIDNAPIRISWAVANPEEVELYSNLKEQKLSEEIKVNKSCQILVNGGFYSTENTHLGLFVSNFKVISPELNSPLLNGFLWIDGNKVVIGSSSPNINPRIAIQSGPLIMQNRLLSTLEIKNDEPARRIVAGTTSNNELIFLVIYRDGSIYQGPLLGQLPKIIELFNKKAEIDIVNAINLDGGDHSIFISSFDRLDELGHAGSYFCVRQPPTRPNL
jgi:uncharacterized protein YigE (DUF2233 family)